MLDEFEIYALRMTLESAFSSDTAVPGTMSSIPSAGHCAAVAILVQSMLGGEFVSTTFHGDSHWFNRIDGCDIDITGDQFGRHSVEIVPQGTLYPNTRVRNASELTQETHERAYRLALRANIGGKFPCPSTDICI